MSGPPKKKAIIDVRPSRGSSTKAEIDVLDLSGDLKAAVSACMDGAANFRAIELAQAFCSGRHANPNLAVYVMGPEDLPFMKVGYANSPAHRLTNIQIGNWHKLKIHALVWFERRAMQVEKLVHHAARDMGTYLRGEWIEADPAEACELILKAARYDKEHACDSATWLNNWASRTAALAEHRKIDKRIAA